MKKRSSKRKRVAAKDREDRLGPLIPNNFGGPGRSSLPSPQPKVKQRTEPSAFFFESDGRSIPNNPTFPALIYKQVLTAKVASHADQFEEIFTRNGWTGCWRWGVYDFHHFHCNAHEALGVARGKATLQLGGPQGSIFYVSAGDLIVLPAGTGHKNLDCSQDFLVVGAYPSGQRNYDTNKGDPTEYSKAVEAIAATPRPDTDPFYGKQGPLLDLWNARAR